MFLLFNNKVCLKKKRSLQQKIINFAIESLASQNMLLNDAYSISDIKISWSTETFALCLFSF